MLGKMFQQTVHRVTRGALHLTPALPHHVQTMLSTQQHLHAVRNVQQDNTGTPQIAPVNHVPTEDVTALEEAKATLLVDSLAQTTQLEGFQLVQRQFMEAVILPTIHVLLETAVATTISQTDGHGYVPVSTEEQIVALVQK